MTTARGRLREQNARHGGGIFPKQHRIRNVFTFAETAKAGRSEQAVNEDGGLHREREIMTKNAMTFDVPPPYTQTLAHTSTSTPTLHTYMHTRV